MRLRTSPPRSRRRPEDGAVLVLTSLFLVAALSLTAMAVDMGLARSERAEYQAAADAAALLATYRVNNGIPVDQVSAEVKALVASNLGLPSSAWASCADTKRLADVAPADQAAGNQCISFNLHPPAGQQVGARVRLPLRDVDTVMGLGIGTIQVTAVAGADGNAGQCDIFDPASCATTTVPPATTTTRPPSTTTTTPRATTTTAPRATTTTTPRATTTTAAPRVTTTTAAPRVTTTTAAPRVTTTTAAPRVTTTTAAPRVTTTTAAPRVTTTTRPPSPTSTIDISF